MIKDKPARGYTSQVGPHSSHISPQFSQISSRPSEGTPSAMLRLSQWFITAKKRERQLPYTVNFVYNTQKDYTNDTPDYTKDV